MDRQEKEDRVSVVGVPQKNRVRKMQQEEIASHEGFLDYTVSSSLERLVVTLETCIEKILREADDADKNGSLLDKTWTQEILIEHPLPFRKEGYILRYFPGPIGTQEKQQIVRSQSLENACTSKRPAEIWPIQNYDVKFHEWFMPCNCLVLLPDSYSGRILDMTEYHTLASAVSIAMNDLRRSKAIQIPIYIPIHDALRDAYDGFCVFQKGCMKFSVDSVHGRIPDLHDLGVLSNRFRFLAKRLIDLSPQVALRCNEIASEIQCHGLDYVADMVGKSVGCWTRITCQIFNAMPSPQDTMQNDGSSGDRFWDAQLPWYPWAVQKDPIGGLEMDILIDDFRFQFESWDQNMKPDILSHVNGCRLIAMDVDHEPDTGNRSFLPLQAAEVPRKFLRCKSICTMSEKEIIQCPVLEEFQSGKTSFSAKLHKLLDWYTLVSGVDEIATVTHDDWWIENAEYFPGELETDYVETLIRNIFNNKDGSQENGAYRETCMLGSLAHRLAFHILLEDSARSMSQIWISFIRELRFSYWEKKVPLPYVENGRKNRHLYQKYCTHMCVIERCLELLDTCIRLIKEKNSMPDMIENCNGVGVSEILEICLLKFPDRRIHVPVTQDLHPTADSITRSFEHVPHVGDHIFKALLESDMQGFKAANPGCEFEDFIRWHSPRDWEQKSDGSYQLSKRMGQEGSLWRQLWDKAEAIPLSKQKSLFDAVKEGEGILHYLENLKPEQVVSQMYLLAFSGMTNFLGALAKDSKFLENQADLIANVAGLYLDFDFISDFHEAKSLNGGWHTEKHVKANLRGLANSLSLLEKSVIAYWSLSLRLKDLFEGEACESIIEQMLLSACESSDMYRGIGVPLKNKETETMRHYLRESNTNKDTWLDGPLSIEHAIHIHGMDGKRENKDIADYRLYISRLPRELRVATCLTDCLQ